jgi:hypothetical protein
MDLSPYVQTVRDGVTSAASLADDHTREVADRLGDSIESSTRLALIGALSDAASNISAELAPSSVEVRMVGQDPELVVSVPKGEGEPTVLQPPNDAEPTDEDVLTEIDDEPVARISLRLPQSVKARVDEVATADGISTNAWLTRAVMDALAGPGRPPLPPRPPAPGQIFGPDGPFGVHGVFGPHGPFGMFRGGAERLDRPSADRPRRPGRVQGWVR